MNSDAVLKELNRLSNDPELTTRQRNTIDIAIQHIKLQGVENETLREDITDMTIPPDED